MQESKLGIPCHSGEGRKELFLQPAWQPTPLQPQGGSHRKWLPPSRAESETEIVSLPNSGGPRLTTICLVMAQSYNSTWKKWLLSTLATTQPPGVT